MNEFERRVADGERTLQIEELRRLKDGRRPFFESWWFLGLMSVQAWPRALVAVREPTSERVWEAAFFGLLFIVVLLAWLLARRTGARRRAELRRELGAERPPPAIGEQQR